MAYVKKYRKSRKTFVRKIRRPMRAGRSRLIRRRLNKYNVHRFVRWEPQDPPTNTLSCNFGISGTSAKGVLFKLNNVTNHSEFTNLYDHYMITGVKVYFDYSPDYSAATSTDTNIANGMYMPKLWIRRDYDDVNTPTLADMTESNQAFCIRFRPNKTSHSIFLKPACLNLVWRNASSTDGYASKWRQWIDCGNPDAEHFGLKLLAQGLASNNLGTITIRCKYYLAFKNVR